ncbi:thrombospondin type 3 repeat-containing protein [Halobacteria archaeon HArc-gm2]|nr:thrombospondin type 3 repeat-containing protein [Halobacteria archaeon HArc-gm2]
MSQWAAVLVSALLFTSTAGALGTTNALDVDGDSRPVATELLEGTDPLTADTDGDGVDDDREHTIGTDPTVADTDDDGLSDGRERSLGTDPSATDTDADGLDDGREVALGSDPTLVDSDDDGLDDAREVELGTDPDAADTDGDGLSDAREVESTAVNATVADTDDDGLGDGEEVDGPTDPTDPDTDGDDLSDGREAEIGTDPTMADTDGDGLTDGAEVTGETAAGVAIADADPLRMDLYVQVYSDTASAAPSSYDAIEDDWAEMPVPNPDGSTGITLHVDDRGTVEQSHTFDGSSSSFRALVEDGKARAGDAYGPYRVVMFVEFDAGRYVGMGRVGGHFSIVNGDRPDLKQRKTMNHELLHNVVGRIEADGRCADDPAHYCEGGWLEPTTNSEQYLPAAIGEQIAENGFAE